MTTYRKPRGESEREAFANKSIKAADKELFNAWMATYPVEHRGKKIPLPALQYIDGKIRYT